MSSSGTLGVPLDVCVARQLSANDRVQPTRRRTNYGFFSNAVSVCTASARTCMTVRRRETSRAVSVEMFSFGGTSLARRPYRGPCRRSPTSRRFSMRRYHASEEDRRVLCTGVHDTVRNWLRPDYALRESRNEFLFAVSRSPYRPSTTLRPQRWLPRYLRSEEFRWPA